MPRCGATFDENDRPPLDKGGLQGGSIRSSENLPLTPSLCKEGGLFSRESSLSSLTTPTTDENDRPPLDKGGLQGGSSQPPVTST